MRRFRGISIGEVTLTTAVVGALTLAAAPKFALATRQAKESALKYELQTMRKAVDTFNIDTGGWPSVVSDLIGEEPPATLVIKGKEVPWGKRIWHGPFLGYGEKGRTHIPTDPVSGHAFTQKRNAVGRLQIFSSAQGKDSQGKLFSEY